MRIRYYTASDAEQIASVFKRSVSELGLRFYSQKQIDAWVARAPSAADVQLRNKDGRITFVSVNEANEIVAYAELEQDGHIDHVYALPDIAGTGVVSKLYNDLEKHAISLGLKKLYTEASEGARRFFLKKNFIEHNKRIFKIEGVTIHNYAMDKTL